jgi:hypothetical protein
MRTSLAILAFTSLGSLAMAQGPDEYAMYQGDSTLNDWGIWRTTDLDGNGDFAAGDELMYLGVDGGNMINYVQDIKYRQENSQHFLYVISTNDMVLRLEDINGDGDTIDVGEIVEWADTRNGGLFSNASPDALDHDPVTGGFYVTDDNWSSGTQPSSGIHYYVDSNNDGDARDAGEFTHYVDALAGLTIGGTTGQVTVDLGDFEGIMYDTTNGVVVGFAQQDCMLYAFQDLNADGDAMDAGEAWNFCNLVDDVPGLELNADVASGVLPNAGCASSSGTGMYATLEVLEFAPGAGPLGEDVYWIMSTAATSTCNGAGGRLYRGIDYNGDLDLNDAGEVVLYYDGANSAQSMPSCYGGAAHDGGFSIRSGGGELYFLKDANNNNDAMDAGDATYMSFDTLGHFVGEMDNMPAGAFAPPAVINPNWTIFGSSGTSSTGSTPTISSNGHPVIGQPLEIYLDGGLAGGNNILFMGFSDTVWNRPPVFNLPYDMVGIGAPGNFLFVAGDYQFQSGSDAAGHAVIPLNIPNNPNFIGWNLYFQWYCSDPAANARGATMSNAAHAIITD